MENDGWSFSPGGTPRRLRPETAQDRVRRLPPAPPTPAPAASAPMSPQPPQLHQVAYPAQVPVQRPTNGMATASLVLGILGFFLPVLSVLALIFGGIGISKANQGATGKGLAIAGLVLGIAGTLVLLYVLGESA
jgi:hypothetical protein